MQDLEHVFLVILIVMFVQIHRKSALLVLMECFDTLICTVKTFVLLHMLGIQPILFVNTKLRILLIILDVRKLNIET